MPEKNNKFLGFIKNIKLSTYIFSAYIITVILAAIMITAGLCIFVYVATRSQNKITVTGTYSQRMQNQIADFSLTIQKTDADKSVAVQNASEASKQVVQQIKDFGIPAEDIQTTSLNIYQKTEPVLRNSTQTYEPGDWVASYTINVTLRDLDKSTDLTELLANVEDASMWGPSLRIDTETVDEATMLSGALEDARKKAEALAEKSGRKLGGVMDISESSSYIPLYKAANAVEGLGGGGGFPIEPGSSESSKTVTVTFRLR